MSIITRTAGSGTAAAVDRGDDRDVTAFGAKGDVTTVTDAVVTAGSVTVTSASSGFSGAKIGMYVVLGQAGVANQTTLSSGLSTSGPITSLPVAALTTDIPPGTVTVVSGGNSQTFSTYGAGTGMTAVALSVAATPTFAFPSGSTVSGTPRSHITTIDAVSGGGTSITLSSAAVTAAASVESRFGTNDSAAIQAAIDDLPARGGVVRFPARGFLCATGIVINKSSVQLRGSGGIRYRVGANNFTYGGGTSLHAVTAGMTLINTNNSGSINVGTVIDGLHLQDEVVSSCTLLAVTNTNHSRVQNCTFSHGAVGIAVTSATNQDSSWGEFSQNLYANNKIGIKCSGSGGVPMGHVAGGAVFVPAGGTGILQETSAYYGRYDSIKFDVRPGGTAMWIVKGRRISIDSCHVELFGGGTGYLIGSTDASATGAPAAVAITGGSIVDDSNPFAQTGVYVVGPNSSNKVHGVSIVGLSVQALIGIRFGANTYGCTVQGGSAEHSTTWVQVDSGGVGHGIVGGSADSNCGAIVDNGTDTYRIAYMGGTSEPEGYQLTGRSGTPEGVITAPVGATYQRRDGAAGTTLYVKESGTGNTGWTPMVSAAAPGTFDRRAAPMRVAASGIQAMTFPKVAGNSGSAPVAGTVHLSRISLLAGSYTNVDFYLASAAATPANWYFALFDVATGTQLALSAEQSSALSGQTGFRAVSLAYTITTAADYWLGTLLGSAGTLPTIVAASGGGQGPFLGTGPSGANYLADAAVHNTGSLTAMPSTVTATGTTGIKAFWFGYR